MKAVVIINIFVWPTPINYSYVAVLSAVADCHSTMNSYRLRHGETSNMHRPYNKELRMHRTMCATVHGRHPYQIHAATRTSRPDGALLELSRDAVICHRLN